MAESGSSAVPPVSELDTAEIKFVLAGGKGCHEGYSLDELHNELEW